MADLIGLVAAKEALVALLVENIESDADIYYGRSPSIGRAATVSVMGGRATTTPEFIGAEGDTDRWTIEVVCTSANLLGRPAHAEASVLVLASDVRKAIRADRSISGTVDHCRILGLELNSVEEMDSFAAEAVVALELYMVR